VNLINLLGNIKIYDAWKVVKNISADKFKEVCRKLISGHTVQNRNYNEKYKLKTKNNANGNGYFCASCKKTISKAEAMFCWSGRNKQRFNGRAYCRECQSKMN